MFWSSDGEFATKWLMYELFSFPEEKSTFSHNKSILQSAAKNWPISLIRSGIII